MSDISIDPFTAVGWQKMQDLKLDGHQRDTMIISQFVRNTLEAFHGGMGNGKEGFLHDEQMKRLNIAIRYAVYKALENIEGLPKTDKQLMKQADDHKFESPFTWCGFQLGTISDYMELPGTPELEKAYKEFVNDYEGEDASK